MPRKKQRNEALSESLSLLIDAAEAAVSVIQRNAVDQRRRLESEIAAARKVLERGAGRQATVDMNRVLEMRSDGMPIVKIAQRLGVSRQAIYAAIRKMPK